MTSKTHIHQLPADTRCHLKDWPKAIANRDRWQESQRNPYCWRALGMISIVLYKVQYNRYFSFCMIFFFSIYPVNGDYFDSNVNYTLLVELKKCYFLPRSKIPPTGNSGCPGYDAKLHLVVRLQFWRLGSVEYLFIVITLRSPLWLRVVVPIRIPSVGQIDQFANYWCLDWDFLYRINKKKMFYKLHKKVNMNVHNSLTCRYKITPDKLKSIECQFCKCKFPFCYN